MKRPKPKTTLKRSRPKKTRSHLPALSQVQRDMMRMVMEADNRLLPSTVSAVMASFDAAANPDAEKVNVVIKTLERDERANVEQAMTGYTQVFNGAIARGRGRLMMDAELDEMIAREGDE